MGEYKTLATKLGALANKNADTTEIEKQMKDLTDRMAYLSVEVMKWNEAYSKIKPPKKSTGNKTWMERIMRPEEKIQ